MNRRQSPKPVLRTARWLFTATLMLATSCLGGDRKAPAEPELDSRVPRSLISDGAHSSGTAGFFFLPPMVSNPGATGLFDGDIGAVQPTIAICDITTSADVACGASTPGATPAIREFTPTSVPPITVDGDKYAVNWDTGDDGFVAGHLYRVHVFAGAARTELGFADVLLTTKPGYAKNTDNQVIALNDGRTLPIHFRIEQGVVPRIGPARSLELTGLPASLPSGAIASVTVTARDANGNVAVGYRGTVAFTSSIPAGGATLPSEYTFTEADAGTHTFTNAIAFTPAGPATLRVADAADATIFGETSLTVLPLAATTLEVTGLNDPTEAGAVNSITVTARDANGNIATGYTGTIAFSSTSDPQATFAENYAFTAADAGTRAFPASVTLRTAGSVTVTATDQAVSTITGAQTVTVTPASAVRLLLSGVPALATAGVAYDLTVTAQDQFGNTATGYGGTVQFSSSDAAAILVPPAYAFQPGDAGMRSFAAGVTFKTVGPQTLQATDAAVPAIAGNMAITVGPGAASQLRFTTQPSNALTETAIAPPVVVTAYDAFGNQASTFTGLIKLVIGTNPSGAALFGDSEVPAVQGVATFADLMLLDAGSGYTLVASSSGLTGATSDPFTITAPAPVEVHWTNPAGGNWSVGSNWSTGAVPAADQTALIDLPGTYTVTLDVNVSVNSFTLGGASGVQSLSTTNSRTLTLATSGNVLASGRLTLNSSVVNGTGTLAILSGGVLNLSGANTINTPLVNAGSVLTFNASTLNGSFSTMTGALLRVQSVGFGGAALTVASGFTNNGAIELASSTANGVTLTVNGTLLNAAGATIANLVGAGGSRTLAAQLDNQGTLTLGTSLTINRGSADHTNGGTIALTGGDLTVSQSGTTPSFSNTGTVTVGAGRLLVVSGGGFTQGSGATLNGGGSLNLNSVNPAALESGFTLSALSLSSTTATFATDISNEALALGINNSTVNGSVTLTNAATKTLTLAGVNTINTALVNAGTLVANGATVLNGNVTTMTGSVLRVLSIGFGGAGLTVASGFTNNATIELTGTTANGVALTVNGTLVNAEGSTIAVLPGAGGTRTITTQLDNRGVLNVGAGLTLGGAAADHINSGTIAMSGGNINLIQTGTTPSFTNNGTVTVAAGRVWAISGGGSFTQGSDATLNGGGAMTMSAVNPAVFGSAFTLASLTLSGGTVASFATDITTETAGALTLNGATINGPGILTNAAGRTLALSAATINAPLVNAGTVVVTAASQMNGSVTTAAGSMLRVLSVGFGGSALTVGSGFTNNGTVELTATVSNGTTLTVNGTLVNAAGAGISVLGVAGGRALNAQLDNRGTFNVGLPLTITRGSADHTNSGTIAVTGGDLTFTQSGTTPSFTNAAGGVIDVASARAVRIATGAVTNEAGASILGAGTFETGANAAFTNAGSVTLALARIGDGFTSTGTFAPVTAEFFGSAAAIPVGAGYSYTNVRVLGGASFAGSVNIPGNLTVFGTGNLTIGAHEITVAGNFATQNTSVLTMQNAAGVLAVGGTATFGGGSTNTRLTAGILRVAGNFAQAGGSAAAFAASGAHLTELNGAGAQSVSFANPGTTTALSHFHRLEIANASAAGVTLASATFATGQLRTPAGSSLARTIGSSAGQTLQAGGLDAAGLVLDRTPLRVVNGEALTRFDDAVFRNMDLAATQFRLDRLSDVVTFNNVQFQTEPTTGVYLHLVDTDMLSPVFTVTMQGTQPANHGGRIIESMPGQLLGWPF